MIEATKVPGERELMRRTEAKRGAKGNKIGGGEERGEEVAII
jgi:hypothetical protein